MKKILIFGSGSIGNHMAYASRKLNYETYVTDINPLALKRMKKKIFPKRYGSWNRNINLIEYNKIFKINKTYDLIIIGTPPKTHLNLYYKCKNRLRFNKILIEKPLTFYNDKNLKKFEKEKLNNKVLCGYNHSVSKSFKYFLSCLEKKNFKIKNIEANWRESWHGILKAHFWLKNEFDSYLGDVKDGGGALQEHSHGLHLLNLILRKYKVDLRNVDFESKNIIYKNRKSNYDIYTSISGIKNQIFFNYQTDLLTSPQDKSIKVSDGMNEIHLIFNYKPNVDAVIFFKNKTKINQKNFFKTRSSEFENEIKSILTSDKETKNLLIKSAIDVMYIIKKTIRNVKK